MANVLDEISEKLDTLIKEWSDFKRKEIQPSIIPLPEFCKNNNISRPTAYAWHERGLIKLEKKGGRQYVLADSVAVKKYQREPQPI
jgi:hypothetical protein